MDAGEKMDLRAKKFPIADRVKMVTINLWDDIDGENYWFQIAFDGSPETHLFGPVELGNAYEFFSDLIETLEYIDYTYSAAVINNPKFYEYALKHGKCLAHWPVRFEGGPTYAALLPLPGPKRRQPTRGYVTGGLR